MPTPIAILLTGEPIPEVARRRGSWVDLVKEAAGGDHEWIVTDLRETAVLPVADGLAGVVITGSPDSVTARKRWMLDGEEALRALVSGGVPTFGICFGHQMLATALGGRVERNPRGRQIGTVALERLDDDPLLGDPSTAERVNTTHVDVVTRVPPGARVLARTALDDNAAIRFGERVWGVQFHPEIDADVMRAYVDARADLVRSEGLDAAGIRRSIDDGAAGRAMLRRFLETL